MGTQTQVPPRLRHGQGDVEAPLLDAVDEGEEDPDVASERLRVQQGTERGAMARPTRCMCKYTTATTHVQVMAARR